MIDLEDKPCPNCLRFACESAEYVENDAIPPGQNPHGMGVRNAILDYRHAHGPIRIKTLLSRVRYARTECACAGIAAGIDKKADGTVEALLRRHVRFYAGVGGDLDYDPRAVIALIMEHWDHLVTTGTAKEVLDEKA